MLVRIYDRIANTRTTWNTTRKEVEILHYPASSKEGAVNVEAFMFDGMAKRSNGTKVGTRIIEGLSVEGTRYQIAKSTHECWFSPDLRKAVLRTNEYADGSSSDRLENIVRGEPDVSSYRPPSDYSENHVYLEQSDTNGER